MSIDEGAIELYPETEGIEVLQKTSIFAKLSFEETARFASIMRMEKLTKGTLIIEQNALGSALFIIRSGRVNIYRREDVDAARNLLNNLGPGEIFGEMSLVDDLLVSADVEVASDEAELVVIPRDRFEQLIRNDDVLTAKVYKGFCRTLSERLRKSNVRIAQLQEQVAAKAS